MDKVKPPQILVMRKHRLHLVRVKTITVPLGPILNALNIFIKKPNASPKLERVEIYIYIYKNMERKC
jgi:hypothetical protein